MHGHGLAEMSDTFVGRQIGGHPNAGSLLAQTGGRIRDLVGLAGRDNDLTTGVDETLGDHEANATAASRDDGTLAVKTEQRLETLVIHGSIMAPKQPSQRVDTPNSGVHQVADRAWAV